MATPAPAPEMTTKEGILASHPLWAAPLNDRRVHSTSRGHAYVQYMPLNQFECPVLGSPRFARDESAQSRARFALFASDGTDARHDGFVAEESVRNLDEGCPETTRAGMIVTHGWRRR